MELNHYFALFRFNYRNIFQQNHPNIYVEEGQ